MSFAVDVNILLYASDSASPLNDKARAFIERCASGDEIVYFAWPTIMAYLRIATHGSVFARPLSPHEAVRNVDGLLALPQVRTVGESDGYWSAYRQTSDDLLPRGNLVPDAHLATILRQHGINTICTHDRDFRRFPFLRLIDPLVARDA